MRVIEYTVHSSSADGAEDTSEVFALVTDLLDPEVYPGLDLACGSPMRWQADTVIGHHKTDMGQGMAVLHSTDPKALPGRCGTAVGLSAGGRGAPAAEPVMTPLGALLGEYRSWLVGIGAWPR